MVEFLLLFYLYSCDERIQYCEYVSPKTIKCNVIYSKFRVNLETFLVMPCNGKYNVLIELQKSC